MNAKIILRAVAAAVLSALVMAFALAKEPADRGGKKSSLNKGAGTPEYAILNINNLTTWHKWDGDANHSPGGDDGLIFPKGTGSVIYQDGVMWGGKAYLDASHLLAAPRQTVRVGGSFYGAGTFPGAVTGSGSSAVREAPSLASVKIYRIRRDYASMSEAELTTDAAGVNELSSETAVTGAMRQAVYDEYHASWTTWPVAKGAPYIERNGTAGYQAPPAFSATFTVDSLVAGNYDEPGVAGSDPNSPADQVIWTVFNDLSEEQTKTIVSSEPLGLEIQKTVWGYKRADALGNLYFSRFKLINKGGVQVNPLDPTALGSFYIDSMYVAQWSDPDLGNAGDDLTGCDTVLSLAYVYNGQASDGEFAGYKLPPPAVGYDFLAGPIVPSPGNTAVFDLKYRANYHNLGMSAYSYFSAGSPYSDPPGDYENGTGRFWKMFLGYAPLGTLTSSYDRYASGPFPTSSFPLSGDPVNGSGFLDGKGTTYSFPPGDRRLLSVTGPFQMAPGDTQEIYIGTVAGIGSDRISSVAVMKFNDEFVQGTFDALFAVPSAPLAPAVNVSEIDGEVMLEWGGNQARVAQIENTVQAAGGFVFEGYNVYQLPSRGSQLSAGKLIANYDLANGVTVIFDRGFDATSGRVYARPVMFGDDDGIKRYFKFDRDYLNDIDKLYNGKEYYLVVTAYTRATVANYLPSVLESQPVVLTVRSKVPFGSPDIAGSLDTIKTVTHTNATAGLSDGNVYPVVVQPTAVTGDSYKVGFKANNTWFLVNTTRGDTLLNNQTNQTADVTSPIAEGIQWRVIGAPQSFKYFFTVANANGAITPFQQGTFAFNSNGFPFTPAGSDRPNGTLQQSTGLTASRGWGIVTGMTSATMSASYTQFISRVTQGGARWPHIIPYDFEWRFVATPQVAWDAYVTETQINVPFELWNIGIGTPTNTADDYRLFPYLLDVDGSGTFNLLTQAGVDTVDNATGAGVADHTVSGGTDDPFTDWVYWLKPADISPGQAGYNAIAAEVTGNTHVYMNATTAAIEPLRRMALAGWNFGSVATGTYSLSMPEAGTIFRIVSTKPNQTSDEFAINTSSYKLATTVETEKAGMEKVGVYPNPYYAFNAEETSRFNRFVTFNNLPSQVKIRIFNLSGQLVRVLEKNNADQYLRWNLMNSYNFPVASGMYIAHVEGSMPSDPNQKAVKVLKLAVIQEQEILTTY